MEPLLFNRALVVLDLIVVAMDVIAAMVGAEIGAGRSCYCCDCFQNSDAHDLQRMPRPIGGGFVAGNQRIYSQIDPNFMTSRVLNTVSIDSKTMSLLLRNNTIIVTEDALLQRTH